MNCHSVPENSSPNGRVVDRQRGLLNDSMFSVFRVSQGYMTTTAVSSVGGELVLLPATFVLTRTAVHLRIGDSWGEYRRGESFPCDSSG